MKRFDSFSAFGAGRGDFTLIKALKSPDQRTLRVAKPSPQKVKFPEKGFK